MIHLDDAQEALLREIVKAFKYDANTPFGFRASTAAQFGFQSSAELAAAVGYFSDHGLIRVFKDDIVEINDPVTKVIATAKGIDAIIELDLNRVKEAAAASQPIDYVNLVVQKAREHWAAAIIIIFVFIIAFLLPAVESVVNLVVLWKRGSTP